MKSRKGLLILAIVLFSGLFFAFRASSFSDSHPVSLQQRLLQHVAQLLEDQHYSPKLINDAFSKRVFKKYIDDMDGDKSLFLEGDVNSLRKYETTIDDEMHGAEIQFVPAVSALYDKRINEVMDIYKSILATPFDFTKDESVQLEGDKLQFVKTEAERKERWRKKIKYLVLERYSDMLDTREKNKGTKDFVVKNDEELEKDARAKVLKILNENYDRIKSTYNENERFNTFINTITNLMDPHSDYFPPVEKRGFDERMSGEFYGIGAQLGKDDYGIKIAAIITGGAAWKLGNEIVVNDIIMKVAQGSGEPVDITSYSTEDAVKLIRGNKGTEVRLTLKKQDGSIKVVSVIREKVVQDQGYARSVIIKQGDDKIGYIILPDFYSNFEEESGAHCAQDVARELIKLKAENVKGVVMDIRNNGGGSLYEVVKMVGLFIKSGPIVQVKERDGKVDQNTWRDNDESVLYDGPLAVLVNEFSASASEIFAGAIQDYKRGIIIGSSSTYGKGTVQRQIPFGTRTDLSTQRTDMGAMTLTFQKFYRVNGGSTQLKGITPDVVLPDMYEYYKIREKDNPDALPWDEIPKAPYRPWQSGAAYENIIKKENEKIRSNSSLNLLQTNLSWLSKNAELPVSLNLVKYKARQKEVVSTVNQNSTLLKIKEEMKVEAMEADKDKYYNNPDKTKGDFYQAWIKSLRTDMHIDESVKIVSEMAHTPQVQTVLK